MSEVSIEELNQQRQENEVIVNRRNMAMRLAVNPDFKKLILQEFCVEECARYAQLSQDPSLTQAQQIDALNIAQAAGHLRRWLQVVNQMGLKAIHDNEALDQFIAESRQEGGD